MSGRKAGFMGKMWGEKGAGFIAGICCVTAVLLWSGEKTVWGQELPGGERAASGQETQTGERISRYSEICSSPDELPEPAGELVDETGKQYRLVSSRVVPSPVTGRVKKLAGEIVYPGVSRSDEVPESAPMELDDRESGQTLEVELPLREVFYENERWESGYTATVTFHSYGADYYRLGEIRVAHSSEAPPLEECAGAILEEAGLPAQEAQIEDFCWQGEPYQGENGERCRDALALIRRKVWDCRAVYAGETALPDYERYRLLAEYEAVPEEREAEPEAVITEESESPGRETARHAGEAQPERSWLRLAVRGMVVTVSLFLLALLAWGFWRLVKRARRADRQ